MKNLNLDPQFSPFKGENLEFENFTFSGGEPHIKINANIDSNTSVKITHRIQSFNDVGLVCLAVDALRRMDINIASLCIPYFPAARQDRIMQVGEPLAVKVYADLINGLQIPKVYLFDPHSDVTPALVNNVHVINNHSFIQQVIDDIGNNTILISPDGGALKKIYQLSEFLGHQEVIECSKHRNVETGVLNGFKVYTDDFEGKDCLIVDDICDGGRTFIGLAQALKTKNAGKLFLAVSHGIFSHGFDELSTYFDRIYTTNSFKDISHPRVNQFKIML